MISSPVALDLYSGGVVERGAIAQLWARASCNETTSFSGRTGDALPQGI